MTTIAGISAPIVSEPRVALPEAMELRWPCTAAVCAAALGLERSHAGVHERIDFTIRLQVVDVRHAIIDAHFESFRGKRPILPRQHATCEVCVDGDLEHLDVAIAGRRVLALSLLRDGRLLYVQSPLLADAGLTGGTYDPPIVRHLVFPHQTVAQLA